MNETCDRCSHRASYRVTKDDGRLYFCAPHAQRSYKGLARQGWTFWPLGIHSIAPQGRK